MPVARFQMPDGRVARFDVPEGTTPEQAQAAFNEFVQAQQGDQAQQPKPVQQGAQQAPETTLGKIADVFTGESRTTSDIAGLQEIGGAPELNSLSVPAFKASIGLLATGDTDSLKGILSNQFGPDVSFREDEAGNTIVQLPSGEYALNKPGISGQDVVSGLFNMLSFSPAGRGAAAVGGGIGKQAAVLGAGSAATQAGLEAVEAGLGGEASMADIATAGAFGAGAPIVAGAAGRAIDEGRRVAGAIKGAAPSAAGDIVEAGARANIPVMTSDIAQPTTFIGRSGQAIGERIPLAGTGGMRATQQEARQRAIQELGNRYPVPDESTIISSLRAQTSRVKRAAGQRLKQFSQRLDDAGPIQYNNTASAIDDAIQELTKPGVIGSDDAARELARLRETLSGGTQTYSTLKENRTAFREVVDAYDGAARSQLPSRARSLLSRVQDAMSRDMDEFARANLDARDVARLREANAVYRQQAQELTRSRLRNVLNTGDITPESAQTLLFSRKPSEVRLLYNSLNQEGKSAARATVIRRAISDATGAEGLSPDRFINAMNKYQTQTGIVFRGDERKQLEGLKLVLDATRRAGQAGVMTATGQQLYAPVGAAAAGSLIGDFGTTMAAGASVGAIARAYESPFFRNALIRIASQPNSDASKQLALRMARELNAAVQTAQSMQEQDMQPEPQGQR